MKLISKRIVFNCQTMFILLFVVFSLIASSNPYFKIDLIISRLIQNINSSVFSDVMWFVSSIGNQPYMIIIVGLISFIYYVNKFKKEAVISSLIAAGSALSGSLIKVIIGRPRPEANLINVSVWLSDKSFPSNHVAVFTSFFGFILYLVLLKTKYIAKKSLLSVFLIILIMAMGISRIYLGAHWASDVLGGYLLGILWLMLAIKLYNSTNGKR